MEGVKDFITTEFCLSLERNFPLVEFIDTPGLTDGTLKYPFDVDQVIYELAEHATMIMVFLDPIGKALVSRCMNVVEKLALNHSAKMSYYLTKFDTAGNEVDRTNVVSQIVQELQGRVRATHALKLHTMYLPERADENTRKTVPNKITDLCQNISKEIDSRVQDVLDQLSKDSKALSQIVDAKVDRNKNCVSHNTWATVWRYTLSALFAAFFSLAAYWGILNFIGRAHDPLGFCLASQVCNIPPKAPGARGATPEASVLNRRACPVVETCLGPASARRWDNCAGARMPLAWIHPGWMRQ
jgi:hypothetical protein